MDEHAALLTSPSSLPGKTTLLNALCGRATYAKVRGDVKFHGRRMKRSDLDFVPQFDDLNGGREMRSGEVP